MGILSQVAKRIKAYHGSPHDFDKFSTENIGTGEGAQAYGHGLYFAEREGTAEGYRNALTNTSFKKSDGAVFDPYDGSMSHPNIKAHIKKTDGDLDGAIEKAQKIIKDNSSSQSVDAATNDLSVLQKLKEDGGISQNKGSMYEVNIDASPDELLDFDAPLSEQSDYVKSKLPQEVFDYFKKTNDPRGINLVHDNPLVPDRAMIREPEYAAQAAAKLNDLGIKGIKYTDAQTRFSGGDRTHNYVMFDDKTIEIARKYGVSMPVAGAILAGTMTPEDAQAASIPKPDNIAFKRALEEREARKGMSRQERMKNPPSPELRKLASSEVLPTLGTIAQGALSGATETIDYLSPVNVARLFADPFNEGVGRFFEPSMTQNAAQTVKGLTNPLLYDERDPEAEKRKKAAMMVGSLFSPI